VKEVRRSPDGRLALVGEGPVIDPSRGEFLTGTWYLHDGVTGRRLTGPISGVALVPPRPFSADDRWFVGYLGDPRAKLPPMTGAGIFSAATGDLVLDLSNRDGLGFWRCFFAPDGRTAAVALGRVMHDGDDTWMQLQIRVIELPSVRELRRFDLPPRRWLRINGWDGRCLEAVVSTPDGPSGGELRTSCVFDLSQDPVGEGIEDPLLREHLDRSPSGEISYWQDGPGWLAYFRILPVRPPSPVEVCRDWVAAKAGMGRPPASGVRVAARFVDRVTGKTRYEFPRPLRHPCFVTPDGRRLAGTTDDGGVEVWDTDPPPRWPAALAAGAALAGGVLSFGWWRGRRLQRTIGSAGRTEGTPNAKEAGTGATSGPE
jgi:hypothetical protein